MLRIDFWDGTVDRKLSHAKNLFVLRARVSAHKIVKPLRVMTAFQITIS